MATVNAHQTHSRSVEVLLGRTVRYQKHKPGRHLLLKRLPKEAFQIASIKRFGNRLVFNDGVIVMEGVPTVIERKGRIALLFSTGEELYFFAE